MLSESPVMAFVATRDAEAARRFYAETLGLTLVSDEDYALVFDCHGTMLRVQKAGEFTPHPFTALGWQVEDIRAEAQALTDRGVEFLRVPGLEQDALGIWAPPGSGALVAWFKDPDGNTLSLTQFG